jgi:hypothetical protein
MAFRSEADNWSRSGRNIISDDRLELIRATMEESGIIVEHWFYRGGSAPERLVFDDFEKFQEYLDGNASPGDAFHVWRYDELCRNDNSLTTGKYPDTDGSVPEGGAY